MDSVLCYIHVQTHLATSINSLDQVDHVQYLFHPLAAFSLHGNRFFIHFRQILSSTTITPTTSLRQTIGHSEGLRVQLLWRAKHRICCNFIQQRRTIKFTSIVCLPVGYSHKTKNTLLVLFRSQSRDKQ